MSQWYHRNSLKSTSTLKFNLPLKSASTAAIQICSGLSNARAAILELVVNGNSDSAKIHEEVINYLSLLQGFILCFNLDKDRSPNQTSRLRNIACFKWTNSILGVFSFNLN